MCKIYNSKYKSSLEPTRTDDLHIKDYLDLLTSWKQKNVDFKGLQLLDEVDIAFKGASDGCSEGK